MLSRLLRAPLGRAVYPLLPPHEFRAASDEPLNAWWRGCGLEFHDFYERIWRDPLYRKARSVAAGQRSTVMELKRMNLYLLIRFFLGDLASQNIFELGVYQGGTSFFMAYLLSQLHTGAKVYAFDTFEGMPATRVGVDIHRAGDFSDANLDQIASAAKAQGLTNIEFIKGDVRETLPPFDRPLGLAHIDLDIYEPILLAQRLLLKRLVPGGYLVYDDATQSSCPGATRAVEEMVRETGIGSEQIFPHYVFRAPA